MLEKLKDILKNKFIKNIIMLTSGTAIAQVLTMLISPIITRVYSPNDYGVLTIYTATLGTISLIGALSYDSAIPIAENDKKAINVLALSNIILFLCTFILILILFFYGENILKLFNAEILIENKYYMVIGFLVTGLYTILTNWALRKKDFQSITKTKLSQSILGNLTKLLLGYISFGNIGLIIGTILGQSAGITTLIKSLLKSNRNLFKYINLNECIWSLKRYKNFPIYYAPTTFILSFSSQAPVIFISTLYGTDVSGFYGLALSITFLPMTFIGKSVQDVFYGEIASIGRKKSNEIKKLSNKLLKKLIIISIIPMSILFFLGPKLFSIIFGEAWKDAGIYSSLLVPFAFAYFIFQPISVIFSIFEKQKKFLVLNILKLILVLNTFIIAKILNLNSYITILIFSIFMSFIEVLKYILAQKILNNEIRN